MMLDHFDRMTLRFLNTLGWASRRVETSLGEVHILDVPGEGTLPPVLLFHGLSSAAADYAPLIRALRPHFRRILAPDLPGHGGSPVPSGGMEPHRLHAAIVEALDQVVREPMIVFGNSLGGIAAVRFAIARPAACRSIVLVSPGGAPQVEQELREFLSTFDLERPGAALTFIRRVWTKSPIPAAWMAWGVSQRFNRPAIREFLRQISPEHLLRAEELRALAMPVHLYWGTEEAIMPLASLHFFERHLPPGAQIARPPGVGHAPFLDRCAEVAGWIRAAASAPPLRDRPPEGASMEEGDRPAA